VAIGDVTGDVPGMNELEVTGSLVTGDVFEGRDRVRVINPPDAGLSASVAPNPLNPSAVLTFRTKHAGTLAVRIFDLQGRLVRTLMQAPLVAAGAHEAKIDGRDGQGKVLASGIYFYRVETDGEMVTGRFAILK
jgi:flagellar hook capping protein FlgD